ncbi:glycosyltransferase family 2 protein [Frankia sp. Cr1]|uniref:glycosyltransferase family 2 protein n=1 Tax=Frankia sp. Cr1 TaxID=3073931 RepID=UPI002AD3101F|nr:glycosyltransferase family 2 protein [Frankia sp. Cr1]
MSPQNRRAPWARLCWAAAAATTVRGVQGTMGTYSSLRWLHAASPDRSEPTSTVRARPFFVLIIPMLREQALIGDTVACFSRMAATYGPASVVVVTTAREDAEHDRSGARLPELAAALAAGTPAFRLVRDFRGVLPVPVLTTLAQTCRGQSAADCAATVQAEFDALPTTSQLAAALAREHPSVRHHHYPDPRGTMADQINHAGRVELDRLAAAGMDMTLVYLAQYTADSRPEPATLTTAARRITDLHEATGSPPCVLQQSALFLANLPTFARGPAGCYLTGTAFLQSRWSLAREIPTWRRHRHQQGTRRRARPGWPRYAHCTGHGLFLHGATFLRWGGLPTRTMNEDLALGFLLSAAGIPIDPIPAVEWADSPTTPMEVIRQKRQWFWSYVDYPTLLRIAADGGLPGEPVASTGVLGLLAAQGLGRGAIWLATSPTLAATCALPLFARRPALGALAAAAAAGIYLAPAYLIVEEIRRRGLRSERLRLREVAGTLGASLTHSAGPWWCLANGLHRAVTGHTYIHDKTER